MLKTQSRFHLDRSFKGPFVVQSVTSTNAVIRGKDIEDAEEINVCQQRLSICSDEMKHSTPWIGHGNRLCKRIQDSEKGILMSSRQVHMKNKERLCTQRLSLEVDAR